MSDSENKSGTAYSADYRSAYPEAPKTQAPFPRPVLPARHPVQPQPARQKQPPTTRGAEPKRPEPKMPPASSTSGQADSGAEIDGFLPDIDQTGKDKPHAEWGAGKEEKPSPAALEERETGEYHRWNFAAGTAVLLLALAGVVLIAIEAGQRIRAAMVDSSAWLSYDKMLSAVVAQDPKPFDSPEKASPQLVLNSSLWQTAADHGSGYTAYDDAGRTIIPLSDVEESCKKLFGPKSSLQPASSSVGMCYTYDAGKAQFHVVLSSLKGAYKPHTISAKKEGDSMVLRVGYLPQSGTVLSGSPGTSSAELYPVKYMEYVVKTDSAAKTDYLYAVRMVS